MERFAESVGAALEPAGQDVSQYLYDPVNAFQLVNRYNGWWAKLHELVFAETGQGRKPKIYFVTDIFNLLFHSLVSLVGKIYVMICTFIFSF